MITRILILICLSITTTAYLCAQNYSFKSHDFDNKKIELSAEEKAMDELMLFQHRKVEILTDGKEPKQYFLLHEKIFVNSDRAIEENNKIYISFSRNSRVVKNKNRVILPNGKTIALNDKDIHEEVDEDSGQKYQYYAVKGLEKGAIIEKLYILEQPLQLTGVTYSFQFGYPIKESTFQLIAPEHLIFKHKSYNGLSEAIESEAFEDEKNMIEVSAQNIKALKTGEKLSNRTAHRQKFRYKLYENTLTGKKNFYNYNQFAKEFYSNFETELTKKEKASLVKFFKSILVSNDERKNILNIESLIKNRISYNRQFEGNKSFEDIFKNKQGNLIETLILYRYAFEYFGIKSEFVLTSNRYDAPFDPDFETTRNLQDVLIYFPNSDQYLDAKNPGLRSPLFNNGLGNTYGMKIKEVSFGGATMATNESVFIDLPKGKISSDTMQIDVDFSKDVGNPFVKSRIVFGGYSGASFQGLRDYVAPNQYQEILDDISKNYSAGVEMESNEAKNDGVAEIGKGNFELNISLYSKDLIQKAGDKYLYEVGRLIGKQSELYQEGERTMPVEMRYQHYYDRVITLQLPDGYKISNPEVLDFDFKLEAEGKTTALFSSSYKIEGNNIIITNKEFYAVVDYTLDEFEQFRSVYNAAADFNKLVVVIEKK